MTTLAPVLLCNGGCAFGNREVSLDYEPAKKAGDIRNKKITVVDFEDGRESVEYDSQIGQLRNVYGMVTADIVANGDPIIWITDALAAEMEQLGYRVERRASTYGSIEGPVITGSINRFFVGGYGSIDPELRITLTLKRGNERVFTEDYRVAEQHESFLGTENDYRKAIHSAMNSILDEAASDVHDALQRETAAAEDNS